MCVCDLFRSFVGKGFAEIFPASDSSLTSIHIPGCPGERSHFSFSFRLLCSLRRFPTEVKGSIHNSGSRCDCSFLPCSSLLLVPQTLLRRSALPWRPVREVGSLGVEVEPQGRGSGGESAAGVLPAAHRWYPSSPLPPGTLS